MGESEFVERVVWVLNGRFVPPGTPDAVRRVVKVSRKKLRDAGRAGQKGLQRKRRSSKEYRRKQGAKKAARTRKARRRGVREPDEWSESKRRGFKYGLIYLPDLERETIADAFYLGDREFPGGPYKKKALIQIEGIGPDDEEITVRTHSAFMTEKAIDWLKERAERIIAQYQIKTILATYLFVTGGVKKKRK